MASHEHAIIGIALLGLFLLVTLVLLCCFCDCGSAMGEFADEYNSMYILDDNEDEIPLSPSGTKGDEKVGCEESYPAENEKKNV
mmetsp:Transcript_119462/g.178481  ORF Transcript_119462/g.178481 Transcript_119462/m.178481 type:complete len:84 (+) Transcript_119462:147-398(+)|eukprot:CAMPEP_0117050786 /NCGR_PEP_ID=MMETSP0472-20121206/35069_1 /TAXON_ID=693140 ORGANISM="Tiarina fusus, Strain LIS" /NCGR_SAMPLE_ID=MMETSP0472 /ASSEMBLY_ACC=CAM_ASM_000603 /LENGTH=83 /DNA_ID=CAMNT_0004764709 /DNA_START=143 /DNA_END=394 /DNA_ORIENTATION=-